MTAYVPYAGYFYVYARPTPDYGHHIGWIIYLIFNNNFSITAHTVAVWLTVSIAVFRYIVVCGRHALGARLCSRRRANVAIAAVVGATVVACVPNYVMYRPVPYDVSPTLLGDESMPTSCGRVTTPNHRDGTSPSQYVATSNHNGNEKTERTT